MVKVQTILLTEDEIVVTGRHPKAVNFKVYYKGNDVTRYITAVVIMSNPLIDGLEWIEELKEEEK